MVEADDCACCCLIYCISASSPAPTTLSAALDGKGDPIKLLLTTLVGVADPVTLAVALFKLKTPLSIE